MATVPIEQAPPAGTLVVKRHGLVVRLAHWLNALAMVFLIGTGLNIFNAHPMLYWGEYGATADVDRRWLSIAAAGRKGGPYGYVEIGSLRVETTGVLGLSTGANGQLQALGFPGWATFPSYRDLGTARNWHFFWAWVLILNGLLYLGHGLVSGHIRRDILPRLKELAPANVLHDIARHARLDFPKGEEARRYHVLQKLAYGGVVLVLVPLVIFTGLGMSPGMNAAWPWLLELFGGRASARSLHFIAMALIAGFVVVHLLMVLLAGPINGIRAMVTGKLRIARESLT